MDVHNYHPGTGEYLWSSLADPDPEVDGGWLIPGDATTTPPPAPGANAVAVFDPGAQSWSVAPDFRGVTYYDAEGEPQEMKGLGPLPGPTDPPPPPPPTGADVNAARAAHIRSGVTITVGAATSVRLIGDDVTLRNLDALALGAQMRLTQGDVLTVTRYRDADNVIHDLLPAHVIQLWQGGTAFVQASYEASWAIKEMDPIPADYGDAARWPAQS